MIKLTLVFEVLFFLPDGWHTYGYYRYVTCIDNIENLSEKIEIGKASFDTSMKTEYERMAKALGSLDIKSIKLNHNYCDFKENDFIGIEKVDGAYHDL